MNHTTNLNLNLPEYIDEADIASMNSNMQTIDYAVGDLDDDIATKITQPPGGTAGQVIEMGSDGEVKWGEKLPVEDVVSAVEDWLNTYMPPQETIAIDRTLTIEGAAADSKSTGDRIRTVAENIASDVRTSTESETDLDISDENGNVILRLKDGNIYTRNFDSTIKDEISTEIKTSSENGIDLDVSDENGNVILRLKDGNIYTKNFDSTNSGGGSSKDVEVRSSSETGIDLDVSDENGNVILRLQNGNIQTKNFISKMPTIITVGSSGSDYTSIREAVEAARTAGASADNPYCIQIAPGNYDILSYYTAEEMTTTGFVGLMVDDGITLEGMGIVRQQTVLYAQMDTETYTQSQRNQVSTINLNGNCGLKNLTVKGKDIRYAIHDDFAFSSTSPKIRRLENCAFYVETSTSGGVGNTSYGAGTDGRKVFLFDDCDFGDLVHIHTNTNSTPNLVIMKNCKGYGLTATDFAATADSHYYVYDSAFNWIEVDKGTGWTQQHIFIHGTTKDAAVCGWSGMEYETGDCQRIQHPYNISSAPLAVAMRTSSRYHVQPATSADNTIGVCFAYNSTEDYAIVQYRGWMCAELLGFNSPSIGQYLTVGSNGSLSLSSSSTGAIGKVVYADYSGFHYIKLNL